MFSSWEAVNVIQQLIHEGTIPPPRRSIRNVLWVDEEISQRGAATYFRDHQDELSRTIIAMESDTGNFDPVGFGFTGTKEAREVIDLIGSTLLSKLGAGNITDDGADVDNGPLCEVGVPCASLTSTGFDGYYFYFHHSMADSITHLNRVGMCFIFLLSS